MNGMKRTGPNFLSFDKIVFLFSRFIVRLIKIIELILYQIFESGFLSSDDYWQDGLYSVFSYKTIFNSSIIFCNTAVGAKSLIDLDSGWGEMAKRLMDEI